MGSETKPQSRAWPGSDNPDLGDWVLFSGDLMAQQPVPGQAKPSTA